MRIAIVGSGAVGGYFGGRLAAAGHDVAFIARGPHLAALRERGLRIESPLGDLHLPQIQATGDAGEVGPVDLVFFTVKLYDSAGALNHLPPLLGPDTLAVSFQNGVDAVGILTGAIGRSHVAGGTTDVSAVVSSPGVIRHTALNRLVFGAIDGKPRPILDRLLEATKSAGIDGVLSEHILVEIWAKFARLTAFSGMTCIARAGIGAVREDPELSKMLRSGLQESIAIARGRQVALPGRFTDEVASTLQSLPPHTRSSMLDDLDRGQPLELPWLSGAVVRIGEEVGVQTPTHRLIVSLLGPHVHGRTA